MSATTRKVLSGVYLVIDPAMQQELLFQRLAQALRSPLAAVQIWDHFQPEQNVQALIEQVCGLCHSAGVPVLINNRWDHLTNLPLDGVHFDAMPADFSLIKATVGRPFITGLTCNNDLRQIQWAADNNMDYISFCSMFPSPTATSCELVHFSTVQQATTIFKQSIFLAGGIRPDNLEQLKTLPYSGVAVISGIMSNDDPAKAIENYYKQLRDKE